MTDATTSGRYEPRVLIRRIERRRPTLLSTLPYALASPVLVPSYLAAAAVLRTPGLRFHAEALAMAGRLIANGGRSLLGQAGRLALYPMDSTRYFELDWVWSRLERLGRVGEYLDISSPRLLPLACLRHGKTRRAWLLNPDVADLAATERWARALSIDRACRFVAATIEALDAEGESSVPRFDLITSVSVFEHIPDETTALAAVRRRLAPGGTLLLTLPCAASGYDQYRDYDEYGLAAPDREGRFFFQRFYDETSLGSRIFAVLGAPRSVTVYGEREPGYFGRNAERKMRGWPYPFWRESYMMGRHFQRYRSIAALPGEGVVALEFKAD